MNFDEGFRRVGLVLGLVGAAVGFTVAFLYGSDLLDVRARAMNFQTMAATYWRVVREHPLVLLSPGAAKQQAVKVKEFYTPEEFTPEEMGVVGPRVKPKAPNGQLTVDDGSLKRQNEALNASGIDSAEIDNSRILSIHTTEGQTILAAEPPFWSWLTLPALPLLGFLIPWGTIRTIIWIKHGFSHKDVKA